MKVAVIGATGYTGMVLLRLLENHPQVDQILPVSSSKPGLKIWAEDPGMGQNLSKFGACGGEFLPVEKAAEMKPDVVFAALPHLESAKVCAPFFGKSVVIDLSADFRIKDRVVFQKAYGQEPPRPDLLDQAVYGLAEWHTAALKKADLIANPGCYPTCSLIPLLPLYQDGVVTGTPIINALSGISGAGKKATVNNLLTERAENTGAYAPGRTHRHSQEIETELGFVIPGKTVIFTPHLVPLKRGMEATIVVDLAPGKGGEDVLASWKAAYAGQPFVQIVQGRIPQSLDTWGSNRLDMGFHVEGDKLIIFSVQDNLMKGASGQAVQNMNLRFGLSETAGLPLVNSI